MFLPDDTIVAISSAAGSAVRAIVRLSGPQALDLAAAVFDSPDNPPTQAAGFTVYNGSVALPPARVPARLYVFRAPRSYTRQDVAEIHLPGAPAVVADVESQLVACGARRADAGEFTARAFFSGRIDLSAAQAVADLINAADAAQVRSAAAAVDGSVHALCSGAADELTDILAAVEAAIDLADEPIELDAPEALARRLADVADRLESAAADAGDVPESADVPRVVLAGRPNVGKSSLLNALTRTPRAIVSAMAGTTRDVLSAVMELDGSPVRLQDAAGLVRQDGQLATATNNAARRAVSAADVILLVVDATTTGQDESEMLTDLRMVNPHAAVVLLSNKIDQPQRPCSDDPPKGVHQRIFTSAVTGEGLKDVIAALQELLTLSAPRSGQTLGLHQRQKAHLRSAAQSVRIAAGHLQAAAAVIDAAEVVSVDLRDALWQLGNISGQVVTEDVLGSIFRRFCVGK